MYIVNASRGSIKNILCTHYILIYSTHNGYEAPQNLPNFILRFRKLNILYLHKVKAFILPLTKIELKIKFLFMKGECPRSQGIFLSQQTTACEIALGQNPCYPLSLSAPSETTFKKDSMCSTCKIKAIFTVAVPNKDFFSSNVPPFLL